MTDVVERYLTLGLQLGRHVDGLVDAYYGPPELAEAAAAGEPVPPDDLAADADGLAADIASSVDLDAQRRGWLGDQVHGLRTYAGVLAGEGLSYADEVEGCYGVRPELCPEDTYLEAHARLDELLPGSGSLAERHERWRSERAASPESLVPALRELAGTLRDRVARLVELPPGEAAVVEEVRDEPWWAFNYYLGELRSRVVVNADVPTTPADLVGLAAHEVYPGHHTESAVKEQRLVRERGWLEESILLVPCPHALVSEGIAETGLTLLFDDELEAELDTVLARHGLEDDLGLALAIIAAGGPLRRVGLDAALLVHEHGAPVEEAEAHVIRWGLSTPERAARSVRFVLDPTWRAYAVTYSAGGDLCEAYVGGDPARFATLLTEQVRVADLLAARA